MRPAPVYGALVFGLALACAAEARAQAVPAAHEPEVRFVVQDLAEVRSGPSSSDQFYPTNRLRRGTPVKVVLDLKDGWLKIQPPAESFSWINTRFLEHPVPHLQNYVVVIDNVEVPVYMGSEVVKGRTVVGAKLKRGAQVISIGPTRADEEGTWMPIEPPPGEFRYLRAEAVGHNPAGGAASASGPTRTASASPPGPSAAPSAGPAPSPEALWQQAEQAERGGQVAEAIRLYFLVAAESFRTNPGRASEAQRRAQYLQADHRTYGAGSGVARAPTEVRYSNPPGVSSPTEGRVYPVPSGTPGPAPVRLPAPTTVLTSTSTRQPAAQNWPTYSGRLRRAGRSVDSHRAYVLESRGYPLMYVVPQSGIDLEPYVDRNVELTGPAVYRGDYRANHMTAVRVQPLP